MPPCLRLPRTGYRGQRYEVRFEDSDGSIHVMGWTNEESGGMLVEAIKAHPTWKNPKVIDLKAKEIV
jgi:hypothetical protein